MIDGLGRSIDYVRISVTDRCDLRCTYCMPADGVEPLCHGDILTYEEIVRIVRLLAELGIKKVRLTGGEPLVRKGMPELVRRIKAVDGIEKVVMTTNGMLLSEQLPALAEAGLDGLNISLDALDEKVFRAITRREGVDRVLSAIDAALTYPEIGVKLNCVPMPVNRSQLIPMCQRFLKDERLSLRFIELMPIGLGAESRGIPEAELKTMLEKRFGALKALEHIPTDGPCKYYTVSGMAGRLGLISAVSDCFCASCNRVRLTSTGFLKTCLQYDRGVELKPLLEKSDGELLSAMRAAISKKPEKHAFSMPDVENREKHTMSQIGG